MFFFEMGLFEVGGCCKPSRRIINQNNEIIRLNIGFNLVGLIQSQNQPFNSDDMLNIPIELLNKGITLNEWKDYTNKLIIILSERRGSLWSYFSLLCCFQCSKHKNEVLNTNQKLIEWENDFNINCLQSKGIYCKIQSYSLQLRERIYSHWIAFSFDKDDIEQLKNEPHLFGSVQDWSCCGGVNENELICHPF